MNKRLSQNNLDQLYKLEVKRIGKVRIEELTSLTKERDNLTKKKSIFLCHSHLDKTIVNKIILLFNKLSIDLYIDWMDVNMPVSASNFTAKIIKEKIEEADKFIFLATYNALRSKWCNWELGLAYSSKGESDLAILPIESRSGKWVGTEYLQLFPELQLDLTNDMENITDNDIKISSSERSINLKKWLSQ